ncbi:unnamed protein product [Medioppia subpectinata]|uniref:non-specific serine/threonine protein kinase n=1 Tax=Medioppia subpectinata TaxID=1979941 RepID=A0A7R9KBD7_9ACAR|nr:unnamed protein product [Medioppia subpectinata]CAG2100076.1 unnamed protein product [Medioppia subpectinata]
MIEITKIDILNEVNSVAKLDSKYVVKYYHSWIESHYVYIQMEFCSQNLESVLKDKPIVFGRQPDKTMNIIEYFVSCEMFYDLLQGIQYLHNQNPPVIHRDIKPKNILIMINDCNKMFIKLCDFGLATEHEQFKSHTRGVGTAGYKAPETVLSKYGIKADIYSLGVVGMEISINWVSHEEYKDATFVERYKKLEQIVYSMINPKENKRPTSSQILEEHRHWSLDKSMITNELHFDKVLNTLNSSNNPFFYQYLLFKTSVIEIDEVSVNWSNRRGDRPII